MRGAFLSDAGMRPLNSMHLLSLPIRVLGNDDAGFFNASSEMLFLLREICLPVKVYSDT